MLTRHQLLRFVEAHLALGEQSHGYRILVLRDRQRVRRAQAVVASNKKPVRFFCGRAVSLEDAARVLAR